MATQYATEPRTRVPSSPRLAELQRSIQVDGATALADFWRELRDRGAPLQERLEGNGDGVLVTFVWRGDETSRVAVVTGPAGCRFDPLHHLQGTDVWYRSYTVPPDTRCTYYLVEDPPAIPDDGGDLAEAMRAGFARRRPDPLNPEQLHLPMPGGGACSNGANAASLLELPAAPRPVWSEPREGVTPGRIEERVLPAGALGGERRIWLHTSGGFPPEKAAGVLVVFDGILMLSPVVSLPTILDNLHASGALPPLVTIMVDHPDAHTRMRDLACHGPFVDFIADEVVPTVAGGRSVAPLDPSRTIVAGGSHGALAAMFAAVGRPDRFANVLSTSGSYWWSPPGEQPEWLARQAATSPVVPRRCHLDVGRFETGWTPNGGPDNVACNRHLRDVLVAKGSEVSYGEFSGGHDVIWLQCTLGDALLWLTRDW